jgi:hypothetical protein
MRVGVAHHLGWARVVVADVDHTVVDRRKIDLIEPGLPAAPVHHDGGAHLLHRTGVPLDDERAGRARVSGASVGAALHDGGARRTRGANARTRRLALGASLPVDFPDEISVQRRVPYESRADSVMYCLVLAESARLRGWDVHRYDAKSVEAEAAGVLGERAHDVLHGPRATWGPPWAKDHRVALAATVLAGAGSP